MDPDKAHSALLVLAFELSKKLDRGQGLSAADEDAVSELCDTVIALDEWLSSGGFKPKDWEK